MAVKQGAAMPKQSNTTLSTAGRRKNRRNHILDAASRCFVEQGFHGAGMALIATAANMSVGQIYRYFPSKEDMIAAIVARQLEQMAARFSVRESNGDEAPTTLSAEAKRTAAELVNSDRPGLIIEIRAEAARNPSIAKIVRSADAVIGEQVRDLIVAGSERIHDQAEIERRTKMLAIVIDGLIFRSVIDADLDEQLANALIDLVCNTDVKFDNLSKKHIG